MPTNQRPDLAFTTERPFLSREVQNFRPPCSLATVVITMSYKGSSIALDLTTNPVFAKLALARGECLRASLAPFLSNRNKINSDPRGGEAMLTKDRTIRFRLVTNANSPRIQSRFRQRRAREMRVATRPVARVESNPNQFLGNMPPSYASRLYAVSAT